MNLRNNLIRCIELGMKNKFIISHLISDGFSLDNILNEIKERNDAEAKIDLGDDVLIENYINKLRETVESNNKYYKDINKHDIISALGHSQTAHVEASNKLFKANKNIDELKEWIIEEIDKAELSAKVQRDEYIKGLFLGQKLAFERIMREIESLDK